MDNKKEVTVYSTPTCPYCVMVKAFLKEKGVEYKDLDVSADENAAREMIERTGQMGVPVIMVNDTIIVGFDQEALTRELGLQ